MITNNFKSKLCFVACSELQVENRQCDCLNRQSNSSNELYTLLPTVFYELKETEFNKLTITEMEDEQIHIALEDLNDFASMDMTKKEAIKMAQTIIKHCM